MPEPTDSPRVRPDDKLKVILDQLARLRLRLNALALQRALFSSLALIIGCGAAMVLVALAFGPLTFLALTVVLIMVLIVGLVRSVRSAWRARVDAAGTASLADRRVDFKDRLTTLVSLTHSGESALWPYLLEETLTQQQEFAVSRVERRRVSRSLYGLLIAGVLASFATTLVLAPAKVGLAGKASVRRQAKEFSGNLQVRPSDDPAADSNADANGDTEATQQPGGNDQAGAEGESPDASADHGKSSKLMDKARELASALQNKITGKKSPQRAKIDLRNSDEAKNRPKSGGGHNGPGSKGESERLADNGGERGGQQQQPMPNSRGGGQEPGVESPQSEPSQSKPNDRMANKPIIEPNKPNSGTGNDFSNGPSGSGAGRNGPGTASHGSGADPEHLFGSPDKPPVAKDGFSITLEARLAESGPAAGGHGYVPPKVRSSLNSTQQPDEPLSRGTVPDDDRETIKRVFEQ